MKKILTKSDKRSLIKNNEEFFAYFNKEIQNIYFAKMTTVYQFKFEDGKIIEFKLESN